MSDLQHTLTQNIKDAQTDYDISRNSGKVAKRDTLKDREIDDLLEGNKTFLGTNPDTAEGDQGGSSLDSSLT